MASLTTEQFIILIFLAFLTFLFIGAIMLSLIYLKSHKKSMPDEPDTNS